MTEVFPQVRTVLLSDASPGAILRIPRMDTSSILAFVTDEIIEGVRSVVMLNVQLSGSPQVILARRWRLDDPYLCYIGKMRFELGMGSDEVDETGHEWWRIPGVIVSTGDGLFIRAGGYKRDPGALVNIQTGALFTDNPPSELYSFGSWKLCLWDDLSCESIELCKFKTIKKQA